MSKALPPVTFVFLKNKEEKSFQLIPKIATDYRFFYATKDLPPEFFEIDSKPYGERAYFDSFGELKRSIENMIEDIELAEVEEHKTKVILYAIEHDDNSRGVTINFQWAPVHKVEVKRHIKQYSKHQQRTEINFYVERRARGSSLGVTYDEFRASDHFHKEYEEMEWSVEREAWFKMMEQAINELGYRLRSGFGSKSSILAKRIDEGAGSFLLQGKEEP